MDHLTKQPDFDGQPKPEKQRRSIFLLLLFLPLLCAGMFCAAQIALLLSVPGDLSQRIAAMATANYKPWEYERFLPVNPALETEVSLETGGNNEVVSVPIRITPRPDATAVVGNTPPPQSTSIAAVPTETPFITPSPSESVTVSATLTDTVTATSTATATATLTSTFTPTTTATLTSTFTPTTTATATSTVTPTPTATTLTSILPTPTFLPTSTPLPPPTTTDTPLPPPTATDTPLPPPTATHTPLPPPTATNTPLPPPTATDTPLPPPTATDTPLPPPTATDTPTFTPTPLPSPVNLTSTHRAVGPNLSPISPITEFVVGGTVDLYHYEVTVTNTSTTDATNVSFQLSTDLTQGTLSLASGNGAFDTATGNWQLATVPAGSSRTAYIRVDVPRTSGLTITSTLMLMAVDQTDSNPADDNSTFVLDYFENYMGMSFTSSGTVTEGNTFTQTFIFNNYSSLSLSDVRVAYNQPAGTNYVSHTVDQGSYDVSSGVWTVGNVGPAPVEYSFPNRVEIRVTWEALPGSSVTGITHTASITNASATDPYPADNTQTTTTSVIAPDAAFSLSKSVSAGTVTVGETFEYTVSVTNSGPGDATGIVITDTLPPEVTYISGSGACTHNSGTVTCDIPFLGGASGTASVTYTVRADQTASPATNSATVTADQPDPDTSNNSASVDVTIVAPTVNLTLDLDDFADPDPVIYEEGDTITLVLILENIGTSPATGVSVQYNQPGEFSYASPVNIIADQGNYDTASDIWTVGTVNPGQVLRARFDVTVNPGTAGSTVSTTSIINSVNETETDITDNDGSEDFIVSGADLEFRRFDFDNSNPAVGDEITATLEIINQGPVTATNIRLSDSFGSGVLGNIDSVTVSHGNSTGGEWNIPALDSGEVATMTITLTVESIAAGTTVSRWREIVASDQIDPDSTPNNGVASEDDYNSYTVVVQPDADLSLTKSATATNVLEGDTFDYQFTVENLGSSDATGVILTDTLPPEVSFVSSAECMASGQDITCNPGTVTNGATVTASVTVRADIAGTARNNASVTSDLSDRNLANNQASVDVTIEPRADIAVSTYGNVTAHEGQVRDTIIRVENVGTVTVNNVQVEVTYSAGITDAGNNGPGFWQNPPIADFGTLAPGEVKSFILYTYPVQGTAGTTQTVDLALTNTDIPDVNAANDTARRTLNVIPGSADLSISEFSISDTSPSEGDTVTITLSVTNNGPSLVDTVVVDAATGDSGLSVVSASATRGSYNTVTDQWTIPSLRVIRTQTLTLTATVNSDTAGNMITRTREIVSSTYADPDSTPGNTLAGEDDIASYSFTVALPAGDLEMTFAAFDPATILAGNNTTLEVSVRNNSSIPVEEVVVNDLLPAGINYVINTTTQGTYDTASNTWSLVDPLVAGGTATIQITANAPASGSFTTTPIVTSNRLTDTNTGNNSLSTTLSVNPAADLNITGASASPATILLNESSTLSVTVQNNGLSPATNTTLAFNLPPYLSVTGNTCASSSQSGSTFSCLIGNLANGSSATPSITVQANGTGSTAINVTASASETDPDTSNNSANIALTVNAPDLTISKSAPSPLYNNIAFDYTITLTNNGTADASNVVITDTLPAGMNFNSASPGCSEASSVVTCTVGNVIAGSTLNFTINVTPAVEGDITNNVSVSLSETDTNPGDNSASSTDTIQPAVDVIVTFYMVNNDTPAQSESISYELRLRNLGPSTATNIIIANPVPAGLTLDSTSATLTGSGGTASYDTATDTWTITQLGSGDLAILNMTTTVTATSGTDITINAQVTGIDQYDTNTGNQSGSVSITVQ